MVIAPAETLPYETKPPESLYALPTSIDAELVLPPLPVTVTTQVSQPSYVPILECDKVYPLKLNLLFPFDVMAILVDPEG